MQSSERFITKVNSKIEYQVKCKTEREFSRSFFLIILENISTFVDTKSHITKYYEETFTFIGAGIDARM